MNPARRQRILELRDAALQYDERDRDAFLRRACEGDAALRADVESLIHQKTGAGNMAQLSTGETLAAGATASPIGTSTAPPPPRTAFHFHPFQAVVLLFSLVVLAAAIVAADAIWRYGALQQELGWIGGSGPGPSRVTAVTPGGPADGKLLPGDRLLAIDGDRRVATLGLYWKRRDLTPERRTPSRSNATASGRPIHLNFDSLNPLGA